MRHFVIAIPATRVGALGTLVGLCGGTMESWDQKPRPVRRKRRYLRTERTVEDGVVAVQFIPGRVRLAALDRSGRMWMTVEGIADALGMSSAGARYHLRASGMGRMIRHTGKYRAMIGFPAKQALLYLKSQTRCSAMRGRTATAVLREYRECFCTR